MSMPSIACEHPEAVPAVDVVVVNYNTAHLLPTCFEALAGGTHRQARVIVVDNASSDGSLAWLSSQGGVDTLIESKTNIGFGRANNLALDSLRSRYTLLLNTDAFPAPGSIDLAMAYLDSRPDVGIVGVRLIGRDGTLQPSCRYFPTPLNVFLNRTGLHRLMPRVRMVDNMEWDHVALRECDWVPGCFYLVRKEVVDQVGLFDPRYFMYYEEVDHCRRVKAAGWKVMYLGTTSCVHLGGESAATVGEVSSAGRQLTGLQAESEWLYMRKHHGRAGALAYMGLALLGDLVIAFKQFLKGQGLARAWATFGHVRLVWHTAQATRWGQHPTR